ncbi:hypothetical protein T265_07157 [Opisthorchis viverrini]|uniref:Uncharacterized protein n=1 Tax=Opisthorchis viverrini TaxID=6198 RepID=A0A074ZPV3_OPIVI|nr:hypothetical protein T265_07157 [Opisthorchis viverrini]KER25355.1 hypothetical protein T265_07157 [Opisthorchis viverrini]
MDLEYVHITVQRSEIEDKVQTLRINRSSSFCMPLVIQETVEVLENFTYLGSCISSYGVRRSLHDADFNRADDLPPAPFKDAGTFLNQCQCSLFESIWEKGIAPDNWGEPIFKKGNRSECSNHRSWLEREFTDRKVRGSNPISDSRIPLFRLGQPGSIAALVLPLGSMAVRHRKGVTVERYGDT